MYDVIRKVMFVLKVHIFNNIKMSGLELNKGIKIIL